MINHGLPYAVNCSLLFTEESLLRRPAAAKSAGFDAIEFWWPFLEPVPAEKDVDRFVDSIRNAGVRLVGLNFFAGDLAGPDCGVLSIPDRAHDFRNNIPVVVDLAERLGVRTFNALYGNRLPEVAQEDQAEVGMENLVEAARQVAMIGGTLLVEAVSGPKPYPLRTATDAMRVVLEAREAGANNVGFLCDIFHLANNDDDVGAAIDTYAADIAHVQVADCPGRGEPGSGRLDIDGYLHQLAGNGYQGWVALEYNPRAGTLPSLEWLPRERRAAKFDALGGTR